MLAAVLAAGLTSIAGGTAAQAATPVPASTSPGVGPIDPNTGYPFWYQDATGERYELCFDRGMPDGLCLAAPENPNQRPYVGDDEAGTNLAADPETFWFAAEASIGANATYVAAKEATFGGTEAAVAGQQIAFGRVRIRVDDLVPGAEYVVTHPYGQQTFVAEDRDGDPATPHDGEINFTEDIGCFDAPCDFGKANDSSVTSYLRWDVANGETVAPAGHVGDPNVAHRVVGSPFGTNFFRVEGPDAGGPGTNAAETDQFSLQGKLWQPNEPMLGIVSTRNMVHFGRVDYTAPAVTPLATQTLTLANAGGGTVPLTLGQLQISGEDSDAFRISTGDSCTNASLTAGTACSVHIEFVPQEGGAAEAELRVPSNGKDAAPFQRVLLRGFAKDPANPDPKDLRATGPLSLEHGFPLWYQDESGLQLALCDDPADTMCPAPAGSYPNGMSFPDNFEDELFWWTGEAEIETESGLEAQLVMAQEAAFLNEVPAVGEQIAFGRIRIRVGGLTAGRTYTVTTPYDEYSFVAEDDEDRGINYTEDLGCLESPCDFTKVNQSNVGPFLQSTGTTAESDYVGGADVAGRVTGSPTGENVFRIEGPNVGGSGVNEIETDLFAVTGKVWRQPEAGLLALSEPSSTIDLGAVAPGATGTVRTLTLTNVGGAPAPVGQLGLQNGSVVEIVDDQCSGQSLDPAANPTCTFGLQLQSGADTTVGGPTQDRVLIGDVSTEAGSQSGMIYLRGRVNAAGTGQAAPSMPALQTADDTGVSPHDGVTNATQLTFTGAGAMGQAVRLFANGVVVGTADPAAGAWAIDADLGEGVHVVTAEYADGTTSAPLTVTVDRTPPTGQPTLSLQAGSDTGTAGDNLTADLTPTVSGTAAAEARIVRLLVGGTAVGTAAVQADGSWTFTLPPLGNGSHALTAVPVDAAGNAGPASAVLAMQTDARLPQVSAPEPQPVTDTAVGAAVRTLVSWSTRDLGSAVESVRLQVSQDGRAFTGVALPEPTATSVRQRLAVGHRYRFRVRAADEAGNVTPWVAAGTFAPRLVQQGSRAVDYTRTRKWDDRRTRRASGGSLTFASARGATASVTTRARSVTLVTSTGPNRGRAAVVVNGRRVRTLDLYAPRTRNRRLAVTVDGLNPRVRSEVTVRVLDRKRRASNGTRVYVDGFLVMR